MERSSVTSSNIASVGWEDGTLEVEFNSGAVYQYLRVPEAEYHNMISADSVGRYFNAYIKNSYDYTGGS